MRIGLVAPGFSASEEDWCIPALLDLVRTLAAEDDVTVFTLRYPHSRERYGVHGAEVVPFGGAQRRGLSRLPLLGRAVVRILRENRRQRFDVLHALWAHEPGFVATLAGRLTRTPVLVSVLGGELVDLPEIGYGGERSTVNRWLIRRALRDAARVTVGSESLERIAAPSAAPGKLVRWPLGVDRSRFSPRPPQEPSPRPSPTPSRPPVGRGRHHPPSATERPVTAERARAPLSLGGCGGWEGEGTGVRGGPIVLHVASLSPVKDQATLLRAFAIVGERLPAARLHVVGDGASRNDLGRLAEQLDVAGRIAWYGAVDHGSLADVYRRADLFVLSSVFESQGMVVLEAAACGCPAVGTAVGVLPELGGPAVRPGDVEGLAELMLSVLQDPGKRAAVVAAQRDAVPAFDLDRTVEQLRRTYGSLVIP